MATLWVAFPDASNLDKTWHITTPVATDIVLYGVAAIPELTSVNGTLGPDGRNVAGTWDGTGLNELDSVSFYLTTDDGQGETLTDGGFYLGTLEQPKTGAPDEQDIRDRQATFPIPGDLPTGDYYVRAVYTEADAVKGTITSSTASVSWVNTAQPDDPDVVTIANAGDLMFRVDVQNDEAPNRYDGYILNVYERGDSGHYVPTPFVNLVREKQSDGSGGMVLPPLFVGGRVSGVDDTGQPAQHALEPGKSYKVGVRAFKNVYDSGGTTVLFTVCSGEVLSGAAELRAVTPPVIEIASSTPHEILTRMEPGQDDEGNPAIVPAQRETFAVPDVEFVATSSVPVAGTWTLDSDAQVGEFGAPTTAVNISLAGLADGDHTLLIQGKDEEGDSFRFSHSFTVDTMPPKLMLSSPTNGGFFDQDGSLLIAGVSDPGALFTVVVDGVPLFGGQPKTVAELGGSMDNDGVFSFTCNVGPGVSSHEILILAADEMGNFAKAICQVSNRGLADISELDIYMDGQLFSNNNLRTNVGRQTQLTLVASTGSGSRSPGAGKFVLTDSDLVDWQAFAVRGTVTVDSSGLLTVGPGSIGYVVGSYRVAEGASMTAAATFGAEAFDGQASRLVTGATIGGQAFISVSGAGDGYFVAGDHVGITAVPSSGYRFVQWSSSGGPSGDGTFLNQYAASTTFVMPDGDVTVTAHFAPAGSDSPPDDEDEYAGPGASIWANAGQLVTLVLPEDAGDDEFVPYHLVNGTRVIVPLSKVEDGKLVFVAPVNGLYGYLRYTGGFDDVGEHWASRYIAFAAARGLFGGVGERLFAPNSSMTRAMFVTVLSRLDGVGGTSVTGGTPPGVGGGFPDVPPGQWYSQAVAWASQNGIVGGHDDGTFGPDQPITREQMCAIFLRYLKYKAYNLDLVAEKASFGDEADISQYALEAVYLCQQFGLIQGKPDNVFDPKANSTRAEACTVFFRLVGAILESLR
jgi:hypothetical protein